ncbi:MAG TPA: hypothetical protein VD860_00835 [Azospirillum sp.]|nr:hypothetical protein [Azospirillum sp.]
MAKVRHSRPNATGRNDTARFVALPHYLLNSLAWRTMSPNAKALLLDVWARHNGANNGDIAYAVREAEGIGLSKDQAARAFAELAERGFLRLHRAATFTLKTKEARTWELTAERRGDLPASKDFMRWRPAANTPATNRTRSHQCDAQSHQRDSKPVCATELPGSVAPARPSGPQTSDPRSHQRDTSNLPWEPGQTAPSEPQRSVAARPSSAGGDATADRGPRLLGDIVASILPAHHLAAAGRTRAERRGPPGPASGITADPRQIDLEELLAVGADPNALSRPSPGKRLRADLARHVDSAPPGELQRLAERVGLSRPQLSNFKAGRFGLNPTAAAMLRRILDGAA